MRTRLFFDIGLVDYVHQCVLLSVYPAREALPEAHFLSQDSDMHPEHSVKISACLKMARVTALLRCLRHVM